MFGKISNAIEDSRNFGAPQRSQVNFYVATARRVAVLPVSRFSRLAGEGQAEVFLGFVRWAFFTIDSDIGGKRNSPPPKFIKTQVAIFLPLSGSWDQNS